MSRRRLPFISDQVATIQKARAAGANWQAIATARLVLWGLNRLYGRCSPPYTPPEDGICMGCEAGRMADHLDGLVRNLRAKAESSKPGSYS